MTAPQTAGKPGLIIGGDIPEREWIDFALGDATVHVECQPFSVIRDEEARQKLAREARSAASMTTLMEVFAPKVASLLRDVDEIDLQVALDVWVAIQIGQSVIFDWRGVLEPDGAALPYTADHFRLACLTVPGFATGFYGRWARPRTRVEQAGNV